MNVRNNMLVHYRYIGDEKSNGDGLGDQSVKKTVFIFFIKRKTSSLFMRSFYSYLLLEYKEFKEICSRRTYF